MTKHFNLKWMYIEPLLSEKDLMFLAKKGNKSDFPLQTYKIKCVWKIKY